MTVEVLGQVGDLGRAADLDGGAVLPLADRARRLRELGDRPREAPREEKAEQQRAGQAGGAPDHRVADHPVHGGERDVAVALDEHAPGRVARPARSTRGPLPRASSRSASGARGIARSRPRARRDARGPAPPVAGGKRIRPLRGPRASTRTSRRASSWNSRTIGCHETSASTTPIRLPFASTTGTARTATAPSSPAPNGLALVAHAVAGGLEALPELEVDLRRVQVGPDEAAPPSRLTPRSAASCDWPCRMPPRISRAVGRAERILARQLERPGEWRRRPWSAAGARPRSTRRCGRRSRPTSASGTSPRGSRGSAGCGG